MKPDTATGLPSSACTEAQQALFYKHLFMILDSAAYRATFAVLVLMLSGLVIPNFYCPWLGLFCFVWGSLCNSRPGVISICAGGLCGLCTCELNVLFQWQAAPQGSTTRQSNSLDVAHRIWHLGWPALCGGWLCVVSPAMELCTPYTVAHGNEGLQRRSWSS